MKRISLVGMMLLIIAAGLTACGSESQGSVGTTKLVAYGVQDPSNQIFWLAGNDLPYISPISQQEGTFQSDRYILGFQAQDGHSYCLEVQQAVWDQANLSTSMDDKDLQPLRESWRCDIVGG